MFIIYILLLFRHGFQYSYRNNAINFKTEISMRNEAYCI